MVFRDITQRRENYEVVRRLSEAVERTADSVFITDLKGRIEYVNSAFEQTTGYTREETLGQTPRILKSGLHDNSYYERLWSTISAGSVFTGTVINRKKNGELYHAEQTVTPVQDAAGNLSHFVSVVKDVTELKKAKEREVEMRLAHQVQQQLYPDRSPEVQGFDIFGAALPADATCGDYYDFIEMSERSAGPGGRRRPGTRSQRRSLDGRDAGLPALADPGQLRPGQHIPPAQPRSVRGHGGQRVRHPDAGRHRSLAADAGPLERGSPSGLRARLLRHAQGDPVRHRPAAGAVSRSELPAEPGDPAQNGDLVVLLTDGVTEVQDPRASSTEPSGRST